MSRYPATAFSALVVATVGAFFVTQHLKVTTPLIQGIRAPTPRAINPYGASCGGVDHGQTQFSFYLPNRSDTASVYIVDAAGNIVRTLASSRHMRRGVRTPDGQFSWNGREDNGSVAPDGTYDIRVALITQGRTFELSTTAGVPISITVRTIPPHPAVTRVTPGVIPFGESSKVRIDYTGNEQRSGMIRLYRTDLPGPLRLIEVKHFPTLWGAHRTVWNGLIDQQPAPAGTYLAGFDVTDGACNVGSFPALRPPVPGTTDGAGISIRYLAADPPLTPTPAGSRVSVNVDARAKPFTWTLWRSGARQPSGHGAARAGEHQAIVKLPPAQGAGLYHLVILSGPHRTDVPVLADHPGAEDVPPILVVVPALTWQGENPVDDNGDGIPNTLANGTSIRLDRVLANGLPSDFGDLSALLAYLDRAHLRYDLTSDVALAEGAGPPLSGHTGVVLASTERWITPQLGSALRTYVMNGGKVLSLGIASLLRTATISNGAASNPSSPSSTDPLGGRPGPLVTRSGDLITQISDGLHIFSGTSGAFPGYASFQPMALTQGSALSAAGTSAGPPSIVGYRLGQGTVVDVGLAGFARSLAGDVDAQEFLGRLWKVLSR